MSAQLDVDTSESIGLFRFLAPIAMLLAILLAQDVAAIRYGNQGELNVLALLFFEAPLILIGYACDVLGRKYSSAKPAWAMFLASSLPPCYIAYRAWLGSAAAIGQQAWTAASLQIGFGWMAAVAVGMISLWITAALVSTRCR